MREDLTPEDIEQYFKAEEEEEIAEEIVKRKRGRPPKQKSELEIPEKLREALKKIDGETTLELMRLLHRSYLSWITEAEAEKYYTITRQAFTEALQQQQMTIKQLTEAFSQQLTQTLTPALDTVSRALETIEERVKSLEKTAEKPVIDDRIITLGAIALKGFKDKIGLPKEIDQILDYIIVDSARSFLMKQRQGQATAETHPQSGVEEGGSEVDENKASDQG